MTLLVGVANDRFSALIADRRITQNGVVLDDCYNKLCVLCCFDARVAIAFTGIATSSGFDTSMWIFDALAGVSGTTPLADILEMLRVEAAPALRDAGLGQHRLDIFVCGVSHDNASSQGTACAYTISNLSAGGLVEPNFHMHVHSAIDGIIVEFAGATDGLSKDAGHQITKVLKSTANKFHTIKRSIGILQKAAASPRSSNLIGENCNSAVFDLEPDQWIRCTYNVGKPNSVAFGPRIVIAGQMQVSDCEVGGAGLICGPKIRKNAPCWCGSGSRFKDCHLKKFGSIYVDTKLFPTPLTPVTKVILDSPVPAGRVFAVQSALS